jgi:hypothetical protein
MNVLGSRLLLLAALLAGFSGCAGDGLRQWSLLESTRCSTGHPGQHVVELWNPDTGSKERRLELEGVEAVDVLDGRLLASGRIDDVVWYRGPAGLLAAPLPVDTTVAFDILRPRLEPAGGR